MAIKIGVLSTGIKGKRIEQALCDLPHFQVTGAFCADPAYGESLGFPVFREFGSLLEKSDAVVLSLPISEGYEMARTALRNFRHVLIDNPAALSLEEVHSLVRLGREAGMHVQAGFGDRFNPAFIALGNVSLRPLYIEAHRSAQRGTGSKGLSLVMDLMVRDIDVVMHLVRSTVKKVSATGVAVMNGSPDLVNARIEFHNGCVANLTASRLDATDSHLMKIFQKNACYTLNFLEKKAEIAVTSEVHREQSPTSLDMDPVKLCLQQFASAIRNDAPLHVSLEEAALSLETAHQVMEKVSYLCQV